MVPYIIFLSFITFFFLLMKKKRENMNTAKLPPGPAKLPIVGNLHQLGNLPHRSLRTLSKTYGDLMFLKLGFVPTLVVSSADRAREIFKHHDIIFSGRPPLYASKKFTYNFSSMSTAPYGDYWREVRKIAVLELMTAKRVGSFGLIRAQEVDSMINRISSSVPGAVDLNSLAFSLSNNIVCQVAFGMMEDPGKIQRILLDVQHLLTEFNVGDYFPCMGWINRINGVDRRINKSFQDLEGFLDGVIEEHRCRVGLDSDNEDIIDVLLGIQKDPHHTISLTDEQIKGVVVDLFAAATDTSAAAIVWTMAELIKNPTVKEKAQKEVRNLVNGKARIQETDLPKLTYLKLVLKESLRLHPPLLLIPRETTDRCTIGDRYEIPAKTMVYFNTAAIGTDPKYWKDPERFWPERFEDGEVDYRGQHFELLPFGAGRRGCPGIGFAVPVVELALANLLFCFDWKLPEGMSVDDVDMEETVGFTVHKKNPLCLVASPVFK